VTGVWSIVVAGGSGRRFGRRKQFSLLGGRPVLEWAVEACRPVSSGVVLVVPAEGSSASSESHGADVVVAGGPSRSESVRRGLDAVPADAVVVLVHDAARPLASASVFDAVVDAVTRGGVDGAVPGLAVADTVKTVTEVDGVRRVAATLDRRTLVVVQTPQAFRADVLRRAHREGAESGIEATDDATLVEAIGGSVCVVPGDPGNFKITTPDDLRAAEERLPAAGAG
jgi:2-C-methyl-D-erythritol 4-phosphate cytidylyltransferase